MKIPILLLTGSILIGACNSTPKESSKKNHAFVKSNQIKMDIEAIKKQLNLQQGMDTADYPGIKRYFLAAIDIDLSLQVIREGLKNAGYDFPDRTEFDQMIKDIYHIENPERKLWMGPALTIPITAKSWKSGENFIASYEENSDQTEDNWYQMVAFDHYNFVFEITPLRKLIQFDKNGDYKITLPQYLIERNNYLFHQDKSALKYLIQNDREFVSSLVVGFSYDTEPEFNGLVLNKYTTGTIEDEGIGKVIFNYKTPGQLVVRKGMLKYVMDNTDQNENKMYRGLEQFTIGLANPQKFTRVSFVDKCKMVAYAGALGETLQNKYIEKNANIWSANTLLTNFKIHYPKFIDEIKKQNYFNEPDIKAAVASAEQAAEVASLHADPE